jgi:hypothetical protein
VACKGETLNPYSVLVKMYDERDHLNDLYVEGSVNIRIGVRETGWVWSRFIWLRMESSWRLL